MTLRQVVVSTLLGWALLGSAGCQNKIVRLVEAGRYDEAIERSQRRRFRPRGKAARAYATALRERGQLERARDVLLKDFRSGAKMESLVALGDLEADMGRRGVAAVHYARAYDLDPPSVRGRPDVCSLFRDRARSLLSMGEALAAEEQMKRRRGACEPADEAMSAEDARLVAEIDAAAEDQVAARVARSECQGQCVESTADERAAAVDRALQTAKDPGSRVRVALGLGARLPPRDVIGVLLDELKGELGPHVLTDEELTTLVGEGVWPDFAPIVMSRPPGEAAWIQLRLASVLEDLPVSPVPRVGPSQAERWAEKAGELEGAERWRVFALQADLAAMELELSSVYRPPPSRPSAAADAEEIDDSMIVPVDVGDTAGPAHWSARVSLTAESLPATLRVAALRAARGQSDLGLELRRTALKRALEARLSIDEVVATEVTRDLASGRPWHALALLEATPATRFEGLRAASASAATLTRVFCEGPCRDDEDEATARRVMGDAWVDTALDGLVRAMSGPRTVVPEGCFSVRELVAADAKGPVATALQDWQRDPRAPGRGEALAAAVESPISLACSRATTLLVLAEGGHAPSAARLAEMYSHGPQMSAAPELDAHARMAMIAGELSRAELLATAAGGASVDPAQTWLGLARFAHRTGHRDLELMGLKEVILHSASLEHGPARRAMVEVALQDLQRGWSESSTSAGRESIAGHVDDYLATFAPPQRHARLRELARSVAGAPWVEDVARPSLLEAMFPDDARRAQMGREIAALNGDAPQPARGPFDLAGLAVNVSAGGVTEIPPILELVAHPAALLPLVHAIALEGRDWIPRWRSAVAMAVLGTARQRVEALESLRGLIGDDPSRQRALVEVVARGPAAVQWSGTRWETRAMLDDPELSFAFAFGLDPQPALVAR